MDRERRCSNADPELTRALIPDNVFTYELVQEIANFLIERVPVKPKVGIICGSGMGGLADNLDKKTSIPYGSIPHFPVSTVPGHAGRLVFGYLRGVPVVCMQGRFHYYEGYPLWMCSMPVRVMKLLGATHLLATNAAGGLNQDFNAGDIMIMKDHVNMMGFSGNNPLQGSNDERFGPRFPAISRAYNSELRKYAKEVAAVKAGISSYLREGVYCIVGGPNYETPAELRLFRMLGVDAVGMSTVHEVITAVHCGMKVFAFSLITNKCILDCESEEEANHAEVVEVAATREKVVQEFISLMVEHIGSKE
ncbi:purine nucleoside phosphorylase isoform X1 [Ischnura elegans]|uniref:purine nucleoside phosphorylase isoform X1 n=1 Tax=Ischnura elegans TaxID=197161 RepID=UPI001ED8A36A|nr:purine nucleoside phosphorylase isoform X1 [Ischnura elegans]